MAEKADDKKSDGKKDDNKPRVIAVSEKKAKQKEVISKLSDVEAQKTPPQPIARKVSLGEFLSQYVSLDFRSLRSKWPFLIGMLLFLTFALIMFAKTGFTFTDVFDFERISANIEKIFSISFILFMVLFSLCMALAMYFGYRMNPTTSFALACLTFIPVLIANAVDPHYLLAYVGLAFAIVIACLISTIMENMNFTTIWKTFGNILMVMVIVAALFTLVKVNAEKDYYFDLFIVSVERLTPQLQGEITGSLSDMIKGIEIEDTNVTDKFVTNPEKYLKRTSVKSLVAAQYPSFREVQLSTLSGEAKTAAVQGIPPAYDLLAATGEDKIIDDTYGALKNPLAKEFSSDFINSIWPELREEIGDKIANAPPAKKLTEAESVKIRKKLDEIKLIRDFKAYFEFFVALMVASVMSLANLIIRGLSSLFCFGLTKLL